MAERKRPARASGRRAAASRAAATAPDVDAFLASRRHPLEQDIQVVRQVIRGADPSIREEVKWSSVSFRNAHDFFAAVNLRSTGAVQLVFHTGVKRKTAAETVVHVDDPGGLIERWAARDRCLVTLGQGASLRSKTAALAAFVRGWLRFVTSDGSP